VTFALVLLVGLSLACGNGLGINPFTAQETVSQSFETSAPPQVVVETFNGTITVVTDTASTVQADVTKRGSGFGQAEAQQDLKNIQVSMTQEGGAIRIIARRTDQRQNTGNSGAAVSLKAPSGTILDLRTSNGSVTVTGSTGDVTVNTSNGRVQVMGGTGHLKLDTSNGSIEVDAENAVVTALTSNGQINFRGTLAQGDHSFRTSNGRIVLTLPASASFRFDATTSNGKIMSDWAVNRVGGTDEDHLGGTVGENSATFIELRTSNGSIELHQGQ
jgi:DUF4097 and DUF4098 domain-containing protein YvlB